MIIFDWVVGLIVGYLLVWVPFTVLVEDTAMYGLFEGAWELLKRVLSFGRYPAKPRVHASQTRIAQLERWHAEFERSGNAELADAIARYAEREEAMVEGLANQYNRGSRFADNSDEWLASQYPSKYHHPYSPACECLKCWHWKRGY